MWLLVLLLVVAFGTDVGVKSHEEESCAEPDPSSLLKTGSTRHRLRTELPRVTIRGAALVRGSREVKLLGSNYVMKAQPWFPPLWVVQRNAKDLAAAAREMKYRASNGAEVLPCVRLGVLFEAAIPQPGTVIDKEWAAKLDAVVAAFAAEGVYVFLDAHQDALSTTNGGEGLPWWIGAELQRTAAARESYIVTPEHPLEIALDHQVADLLRGIGVPVPEVLTVPGDKDPWRPYSVGANDGHPRHMNVGNLNIRLNNNDAAWGRGTLVLSKQVQNFAHRFYNSHKDAADRRLMFDPFVSFIKHLCGVWENHTNVVAVEVLNEPPLAGLPDITKAMASRRDLFKFYEALLVELDAAHIRTPIAYEDLMGGVVGAGPIMTLASVLPLSLSSLWRMERWAAKGQLMFAFHHYPGYFYSTGLPKMVRLAQKAARWFFGSIPVWLSEYYHSEAGQQANTLVEAAEYGCSVVTHWHQADVAFTGTHGWYWYPKNVTKYGEPINGSGAVNQKAWEEYEKTVRAATFNGAAINGANGAKGEDVLSMAPAVDPALRTRELVWDLDDEERGVQSPRDLLAEPDSFWQDEDEDTDEQQHAPAP